MTNQYSKPIGPSRPIGRDTTGKYVFPTSPDTGIKTDPGKSPDWSRGGSGAAGSSSPSSGGKITPELRTQLETQQKARKEADRKRIESETRSKLAEASNRYRQDLRGIKDIGQRQERLQQASRERQQIKDEGGRAKVDAGVITKYTSLQERYESRLKSQLERIESGELKSVKYGEGKITKENVSSYRKLFEGQGKKSQVDIQSKRIYDLPKYDSKFKHPTTSTRTDLSYMDVQPPKINALQEIIKPPLKFLSGEYDWQKKIEKGFGKKQSSITPEEVIKHDIETPYSTLFKQGNIPSLVRKTAWLGGEKFVGQTEKLRTKIFGGEQISSTQQQQVGVLIGGFALGSAFSPVFGTGMASQGAKAKTIQKQLSKNKFDKLKELMDDLTAEIKNKPTRTEQLKYLKKFRDTIKDLKAKANYDKFVLELEKKGILKTPEVHIKTGEKGELIFETQAPIQPEGILIDVRTDIPSSIPKAGEIAGISTNIRQTDLDLSKVRQTSFIDSEQNSILKIKEVSVLLPRTKQVQQSKQGIKQISLLKTEQVQKLKQEQKTEQKSKQAMKLLSLLRTQQALKLEPKQIQALKFGTQQPQKKSEKTIKKIPLFESSKTQVKTEAENILKVFTAFAKQKGEDVKIGTFQTKEKAEKKLRKFLSEDISASGIITQAGKREKIGMFGLGFRPSKPENVWRIVERRSKRLDTPSEVFQIQQARKRKTGKSKNSWF